MKLRSTIRLLILMAVFGFSLSNRVERTKGGHLSFNKKNKSMQNITSQKFFLYARKSTDVEDKQVLSIETQIAELRTFAKQNNLNIIEELVEKQSAKIPGRPIFNEMIKRIEKNEADGILAWHPDRLARNSAIWSSIERTCLSSTSVDLRAYKKNFCGDKFSIV